MKALKNVTKIYVIIMVLSLVYSCGSDDSNMEQIPQETEKTIYGQISENPDLTSFTMALEKLNELKNTLDDTSVILTKTDEFTVFAPTNDVFDSFLLNNGYDSVEAIDMDNPDDLDFLADYVYSHITQQSTTSGSLKSEELGYLTTYTDNAMSMFFNTENGNIVLNGASSIVEADINATNGTVHIVDNVIPIPTLSTFIETNPNFSNMKQALDIIKDEEGSTISNDLTDVLHYTAFIPVDAAFENFFKELGVSNIDEIIPYELENIVESHMLPDVDFDSDDLEGFIGKTISTIINTIDVDKEESYLLTDPEERTAAVTRTDIRASNGFLHIIDKVLLSGK